MPQGDLRSLPVGVKHLVVNWRTTLHRLTAVDDVFCHVNNHLIYDQALSHSRRGRFRRTAWVMRILTVEFRFGLQHCLRLLSTPSSITRFQEVTLDGRNVICGLLLNKGIKTCIASPAIVMCSKIEKFSLRIIEIFIMKKNITTTLAI